MTDHENPPKILEAIIREMREGTQTLILEAIPGGRRSKFSQTSQEPAKLVQFGIDPAWAHIS